MGQRGPQPKPTHLRVLEGETRPSRLNAAEPQPLNRAARPPEWLSDAGRVEWDRVLPELRAMGAGRESDAPALAAYCEAVARLAAASQLVARGGMLLRGREGNMVKNPAVSMASAASADVRYWAREFGLTPAARQPLRVEVTARAAGVAAERLLS